LSLPLAGIRLLDFTHLLPGELCASVLTDLGCDVIRIEPTIPGLASKLPPIVEGESLYYWSIHRNKKRIAVDLKRSEGKEIAHRFLKTADVLIENFRPGVMKRLGIGYTEAHKIKPEIVYCSISGYGHDTSWADRPGHDLNFVAEAGVLDVSRAQTGRPVLPGALISDYTAGLYGALSVVSALLARTSTGKGRHIDISMFESTVSTQQIMATALTYLGITRDQAPFAYPAEIPQYTVYECADGKYLAIAPLEMPFWNIFCEIAGLTDLQNKVVQPDDNHIAKRIAAAIRTKPLPAWIELFDGSNCCVSPVNTVSEALNMVPARERNLVQTIEHPVLGRIPQIASPALSKQERRTAFKSVVASDTDAIKAIKDLGYSAKDIKQLLSDKVIEFRHATELN
jgi:crotonobetainyl-CoA:carnitine CoA-transferase CaiB-like acyl-CoA transferase